jgi:predicted Fe-Mo cluster-binding NifX family protein
MKTAIPVNEKSINSEVCPSFGRAPYFLFYETATGENYFLDNSAVASQGGAGIRAAQVIADHGARAVLTPRCGENAEEVLRKAEVLVYKSKRARQRKISTPCWPTSFCCSAISTRASTDMHNGAPAVAVLSGKGGTGKTLVSVNLAAAAENCVYIDCDVESPTGIFFSNRKSCSAKR